MKEFINDGLIIHTKLHYTINRGKRHYTDERPENVFNKSIFTFEAFMYPPLMLLPQTWERYNYTYHDVQKTYEKREASYIWQLSLMLLGGIYEAESCTAGVRSTTQSPFCFLFISRKTVFEILVQTFNNYITKGVNNVLCYERKDHVPLLPKVSVSKKDFESMKLLVPSKKPTFIWTVVYPRLYKYKDILLVPIEYDTTNHLILMNRVIERDKYDQLPVKPKRCIITLPSIIMCNDIEYVLLEEACFFINNSKSGKTSVKTAVNGKKRKFGGSYNGYLRKRKRTQM